MSFKLKSLWWKTTAWYWLVEGRRDLLAVKRQEVEVEVGQLRRENPEGESHEEPAVCNDVTMLD